MPWRMLRTGVRRQQQHLTSLGKMAVGNDIISGPFTGRRGMGREFLAVAGQDAVETQRIHNKIKKLKKCKIFFIIEKLEVPGGVPGSREEGGARTLIFLVLFKARQNGLTSFPDCFYGLRF